MFTPFAKRFQAKPSFIRDILKVANKEGVISFAGGLPNDALFDYNNLVHTATDVLKHEPELLQYAQTQGHEKLRAYIQAELINYCEDKNDLLITNGSQQGLDLIAKLFLDEGDTVFLEEPSYLGAMQSFLVYGAKFEGIALEADGINLQALEEKLNTHKPKFFYIIPNFQNPSSISYSLEKRQALAKLAKKHDLLLVEDDPYGRLNYKGSYLPSLANLAPSHTISLGSFSKTVVPGFRLGYIHAPKAIMKQLIVAKEASDLHTNNLSQSMLYQYLQSHDLNLHLNIIKTAYAKKRACMQEALKQYFKDDICIHSSEGGMFLWVSFQQGLHATRLFEESIKQNVAFVPGEVFAISENFNNYARLNFTNSSEEEIRQGIKTLYEVTSGLTKKQ